MKKSLQTPFQSRQYMLSKDFEIYYYDDSHFSGVANHSHDYYEFYFFLKGDITMHIDGVDHKLRMGDIVLIPPGVPHHCTNHNPDIPYRRFVFWLTESYYRRLYSISEDFIYIAILAHEHKKYVHHNDIIAFNTIQARLFRLIEEIHSERFGHLTKIALCVEDLIFHINRITYEHYQPKAVKEKQNLYENLIMYIEEHLDEDLTLDHLANVFFVSKFHISHVFKENLGLSIHQYITKKGLPCVVTLFLATTTSARPSCCMVLKIIPVSSEPLKRNMVSHRKNIEIFIRLKRCK